MKTIRQSVLPVLLISCIGVLLVSCTATQIVRTLPPEVHNITIPMCENKTPEPGLSELLIRQVTEEFLADGRLRVTGKKDADVVLKLTITDFSNNVLTTRAKDEFPVTNIIEIRVLLDILKNDSHNTPIRTGANVSVFQSYISDVRRVNFEPEPDAMTALLQNLSGRIVIETISGK